MPLKKYHYDESFGSFVRKKRLERDISLRKFADRCDMSPVYLSKIETGDYKPPAEDKIKNIAKHLKIDADELLRLAGKVDSDLYKMILNDPELPQFLRLKYGKKDEK